MEGICVCSISFCRGIRPVSLLPPELPHKFDNWHENQVCIDSFRIQQGMETHLQHFKTSVNLTTVKSYFVFGDIVSVFGPSYQPSKRESLLYYDFNHVATSFPVMDYMFMFRDLNILNHGDVFNEVVESNLLIIAHVPRYVNS